jgi:hypothetical protein
VTVADAWALLGIAATDEPREVKRAYARVLKTIDADLDPEAFKDLRSAYETALAWGTRVPEWEDDEFDSDADFDAGEPLPEIHWESEDFDQALGLPAWDWDPGWRPASASEIGGRAGEIALELEALLFGEEAPDPARIAELGGALIAATEDANVDEAAAAEAWLVEAIASSPPRSDPLIEPALRRFGWGRIETQWRHDNAVASVLARRGDLRFAAALKRESHPQHRAFVELSGPPRSRLGMFQLGLAADVRDLLRIVDDNHPTVVADFNPDSHAWWRRYFLGPHLPDYYWLIVFLLSPLLIVPAKLLWDSTALGRTLAGFALLVLACIAAVASAVAGWSRIAGRMRLRADERRWRGEDAATGKGLACALAALVLPLVASLVQTGTATSVIYTIAALSIAGGLALHAPPPAFEEESESSRRRFVAGLTAIATIAILAAVWSEVLPDLIAPMAALAFAAARGGLSAGAELRRRGRSAELAALGCAALLCAMPLAAVLVTAPSLPPATFLVLAPVAFVAQHFATSASAIVTARLEWAVRVAALLFHFAAAESLYAGDRLRSFTAAVVLYLLAYGLARIYLVARETLRLPARPRSGI